MVESKYVQLLSHEFPLFLPLQLLMLVFHNIKSANTGNNFIKACIPKFYNEHLCGNASLL